MPSPERTPHTLQELAELYRVAQERLGLYSSVRALEEFVGVNLVHPSTSGGWFGNLFATVRLLRRLSRLLTSHYYNLNRAVGAGKAFPSPHGPNLYGREVSLRRLYEDLGHVLDDIITVTALPATPPTRTPSGPVVAPAGSPQGSAESPGAPGDTRQERLDALDDRLDEVEDELGRAFKQLEHDFDETLVAVEHFDWPDPDIEDDFEKEYRDLLDAELEALEKEIKRMEQDAEASAAELRKEIAAAGTKTSIKTAAVTDAAVLQPGRADLIDYGLDDKLSEGWIRITGPHPCAFCSMLASRGKFYLTAESAGRAWHENCHCSVVPVYLTEPARSARDQFFQDMWGKVASGKPDPLNAWRNWLAKAYAQGQVPDQDVYGPARPARAAENPIYSLEEPE